MPTIDELRAKITPYGPWHRVAPGTPVERCRSCAVMVYWIQTPRGKPMPIDCGLRGGQPPLPSMLKNAGRWGIGVSHFMTCPDAEQWSKSKSPKA